MAHSKEKKMNNEFIGYISRIGEIEQFDTSRGTTCLTREIVVTTDEQYPRSASFTLRNDLAKSFSLHIGQRVRVDFDIDARPNRDGSRYFNQLKAWRLTPC